MYLVNRPCTCPTYQSEIAAYRAFACDTCGSPIYVPHVTVWGGPSYFRTCDCTDGATQIVRASGDHQNLTILEYTA